MTQDQRNKKAEQLRLAAQIIETGCGWERRQIDGSGLWLESGSFIGPAEAIMSGYEIRIKEPVIPVPEGWRELTDSEKTEDFIQGARYLSDGSLSDGSKEWCSLTSGCYAYKPQRIIVPVTKPKKRVPLGPEDVVPGSVIRAYTFADGVFSMIVHQNYIGINIVNQDKEIEFFGWKALMVDWQIKRFGHTEWQPCFKEVES